MAITTGSFASDFTKGLGDAHLSDGGEQAPLAPKFSQSQPLSMDAVEYPGASDRT